MIYRDKKGNLFFSFIYIKENIESQRILGKPLNWFHKIDIQRFSVEPKQPLRKI